MAGRITISALVKQGKLGLDGDGDGGGGGGLRSHGQEDTVVLVHVLLVLENKLDMPQLEFVLFEFLALPQGLLVPSGSWNSIPD